MEAFLAAFAGSFLEVLFCSSLESWDFILAALFLWMIFFFAARSASEVANLISSLFLDLFARRTAISSFFIKSLFTVVLFLEPLRALLAVFVTGILV